MEPEVNTIEKLSSLYRSYSPRANDVKRKVSFTKLKKPMDTQIISNYDEFSNSQSVSPPSFCQSINSFSLTPEVMSCQTSDSDHCANIPPCSEMFSPDPKNPVLYFTPGKSSVRSTESEKFLYVQQGPGKEDVNHSEPSVESVPESDELTKLTVVTENSEIAPNLEPIFVTEKTLSLGPREPSFIYDTTVEGFSNTGAYIDDCQPENIISVDNQEDFKCISVIGQIVNSDENYTNNLPENTQVDSLEVKFDRDLDTSISCDERVACDQTVSEDNDFRTVRTVTSSEHTPEKNITQSIPVPCRDMADHRRLSDVSIGDVGKISTTPEGEKYFMKREESFIKKIDQGELHNLAVEISDYCNIDDTLILEDLLVLPVDTNPENTIEISNLDENSRLTVKPVEPIVKRLPVSSYEAIYDNLSLDDFDNCTKMTPADIVSNLGDKYQGTVEIPDTVISSFEDLYQRSCENVADNYGSSMLGLSIEPPLERWSAPVGSVEPPILQEDEFVTRFDLVKDRTKSHWQDIESMMSTETLLGQERDTSTLPKKA